MAIYQIIKNKYIAILGLSNILFVSSLPSAVANGITGESSSEFSLTAGNQVYLNSRGNFEGDPNESADDALIYAHNGFTMNALGSTILPAKRDSSGNISTDANNLKILVNNAVAVNSTNPEINAPNNPYSNLTPPPQVAEQNSGGINLGSTQFYNSAIFAPDTINMNNTARFSGGSLVASMSDINFIDVRWLFFYL